MLFFYTPKCKHDEKFAFPLYFHTILKANGFWPIEGDSRSFIFQLLKMIYSLWNWVAISSIAYLLIPEMAFVIMKSVDVASAVQNLCASLMAAMVITRMLHMRFYNESMKRLLQIFVDKIWIKQQTHPQIFEQCIARMKPAFYMGVSLGFATILYSLMPIAILLMSHQTLEYPEKRLPYFMLFPYDHQEPLNFILTSIACFICALFGLTQFYSMDALFSLFVGFLCGQFEILHGRIMRLIPECHAEWVKIEGGASAVNGGNIRKLQDMYTKRLHELTAHHNELISFSMDMEKFFSFPLLVNFITATFQIGFGCFQFLISGKNSYVDFFRFFFYLLTVTGQLYVICNLGDMLIVRSTDTAYYLYMCNWEGGYMSHNAPLMLQRNDMESDALNAKQPLWSHINYHPTGRDFQHKLIFMTMRSQRSIQLTAMKFTILSLETFSTILSSALSYFAVLKTFLDKQNQNASGN